MIRTLRATSSAQAWIDQFETVDRPCAELLMDSLLLVDASRYEQTIARLVEQVAAGPGAVALYAVLPPRALPKRESAPPPHFLPPRRYYFPEDPSTRPAAAGVGANKGSEAAMAYLLRDVAASIDPRRVLDHPSLHSLRSTKCHRLVLLDDLVATGTRAITFLDALASHPTMSSWISFGYVRASVIAYGGTAAAVNRIRRHRLVDEVKVAVSVPRGRSFWTRAQRSEIEALCRRYAERTERPRFPLGFQDAMTMIVFQHGCPNTAPAILWSSRKEQGSRLGWRALFAGRPGLEGSTAWPLAVDADARQRQALSGIHQERLARGGWQRHLDVDARKRIIVLAAIARGVRKREALGDLAEVDYDRVEELLGELRRREWIDENDYITPSGLRELAYARGLTSRSARPVDLKEGYYYPSQLREASSRSSAAR